MTEGDTICLAYGRCSVCVNAGTLSDFAIPRCEKFYSNRGVLVVDPLTDMPTTDLSAVQQLVELGRQPCKAKNTAHDSKCDHAFVRVLHPADPFTNTAIANRLCWNHPAVLL